MTRRLYPFIDHPSSTSSGTSANVTWTLTTYRPNPFKGLDRVVFAVDEWGHRNLGRMHRPLLGWLCVRWERRQTGGRS